MSSTCRVQPWRWCGADREQFWVKILYQNCQHCNSIMSEINWNPWMEFFPGRISAGIKVIHVCRHNTPWCLMRELVTESTTVATAPVVYYPMFSQQSIISNWVGAAGHKRETCSSWWLDWKVALPSWPIGTTSVCIKSALDDSPASVWSVSLPLFSQLRAQLHSLHIRCAWVQLQENQHILRQFWSKKNFFWETNWQKKSHNYWHQVMTQLVWAFICFVLIKSEPGITFPVLYFTQSVKSATATGAQFLQGGSPLQLYLYYNINWFSYLLKVATPQVSTSDLTPSPAVKISYFLSLNGNALITCYNCFTL